MLQPEGSRLSMQPPAPPRQRTAGPEREAVKPITMLHKPLTKLRIAMYGPFKKNPLLKFHHTRYKESVRDSHNEDAIIPNSA
jgi:hypothetical protein